VKQSISAALAAVVIAAASMVPTVVAAQDTYPDRPITMIVPFAPGGASDVVARIIQPKLSEILGQNVVVENRPGAGGNIAVDSVVQAEPDGYTIILANIGTMAINPHIYKDMTFDPLADLKPVTELVAVPGIFVVNPSIGVKTVAEFVDYAKANPGLSFSSSGSAALNRLQMELFKLEAGLEMTHVPYSGGAGPSVAAVVGGHVPTCMTSLSSALSQVKEGQLVALGVATAERLPVLPDVPTMVESGFPNHVSASWQGVLVPKETDDAIVQKLYDALIATVNDPETRKRLEDTTSFVETSKDPAAFAAFMKAESDKWKGVIEKTGATAD
jgi:tripartite-type tricarboxylate transporter receptor subunit TctC